MTILTDKNSAAPIIPTRYIIHPTSDNSSNADVIITAVRTYFDMSIKKSDAFSQIEILFTNPFSMTKIIKIVLCTKLWSINMKTVVLL